MSRSNYIRLTAPQKKIIDHLKKGAYIIKDDDEYFLHGAVTRVSPSVVKKFEENGLIENDPNSESNKLILTQITNPMSKINFKTTRLPHSKKYQSQLSHIRTQVEDKFPEPVKKAKAEELVTKTISELIKNLSELGYDPGRANFSIFYRE